MRSKTGVYACESGFAMPRNGRGSARQLVVTCREPGRPGLLTHKNVLGRGLPMGRWPSMTARPSSLRTRIHVTAAPTSRGCRCLCLPYRIPPLSLLRPSRSATLPLGWSARPVTPSEPGHPGDPAQWRGHAVRRVQDRRRADQGVPRRRGATALPRRARVHDRVAELTSQIVAALTRRSSDGRTFHIEDVQDQVELALMRSEHHKVARAYVLYREERARRRAPRRPLRRLRRQRQPRPLQDDAARRRARSPLDNARLDAGHRAKPAPASTAIDAEAVLTETHRNLYDGISQDELALAPILAARTLIETRAELRLCQRAPSPRQAAPRGPELSSPARPTSPTQAEMAERYAEYFPAYVKTGIADRAARSRTRPLRPRRASPRR